MSQRALCTFADSAMQPLLDLALPRLQEYAARHGYRLVNPYLPALRWLCRDSAWRDGDRPASWYKVPLMLMQFRSGFKECLWLDADTILFDLAEDLAARVPAPCRSAMVMHTTDCGHIPNCGVWYCRDSFAPTLERIWSMTQHIHSGWWEQSALIELQGFHASELFRNTYWLNDGWNAVPTHRNWPVKQPRILHASGMAMPERISHMTRWSKGDL